jgi:hypothetical protein
MPIELIVEDLPEDTPWIELLDYSFIMYQPLGSRDGRDRLREKYT